MSGPHKRDLPTAPLRCALILVLTLLVPLSGGQAVETEGQDLQDARRIASVSTALTSLGVAHVLPESMGGVDGTARLIREGIAVQEGQAKGKIFRLEKLTDEEIKAASAHLAISYENGCLRIVMKSGERIVAR